MLPLGRFIITFPLTVSELDAAAKVRVPWVVSAVVPIVTEAHAALYPVGIVTVRSLELVCSPIKTSSPATGIDAPEAPPEVAAQVEVAFQFPLFATAYLEAALAVEVPTSATVSVSNIEAVNFFIVFSEVFKTNCFPC